MAFHVTHHRGRHRRTCVSFWTLLKRGFTRSHQPVAGKKFFWHSLYGTGKSENVGQPANSSAQRANPKSPEDFMKIINLEKLLIVAALLCTPLMASNAQAPRRGFQPAPT